MFPALRRFEKGARCHSASTVIPRSGAKSTKGVRPRSGKALAATPRKMRLLCAMQSDLTQNTQYEAPLADSPADSFSDPENETPHLDEVTQTEAMASEKSDPEQPSADEAVPVPQRRRRVVKKQMFEFETGDEVVIKVENIRPFGGLVNLVDRPKKTAFLPVRFFPSALMSEVGTPLPPNPPEKRIELGLRTKATVYHVDPGLSFAMGGLVVSARHYGRKILSRRLHQLQDLCTQEGETIRGYITNRNRGGLVVSVMGHSCFLPRSCCGKEVSQLFLYPAEAFQSEIKNKEVDVCITEINDQRERVIVSNIAAENAKALRDLRIGSLIRGRIQNMETYGAFVSINDTERTGLLHIRNMSQGIVHQPEDVFSVGEEIYAVLLDLSPELNRFSLSTAELEETRGQIIYNKEAVMENAPAMAARLQAELDLAREERMSETAENQT